MKNSRKILLALLIFVAATTLVISITQLIKSKPAREADKPQKENSRQQTSHSIDQFKKVLGIIEEAKRCAQAGQISEARKLLKDLPIEGVLNAKEISMIEESIQKMSQSLFYENDEDVVYHEVKQGESLTTISNKYRTDGLKPDFGAIMIANKLKSYTVHPGQKLRIPMGKFSIVIFKQGFKLWLCYEGIMIKSYPIGIGKSNGTPAGLFKISSKTVKPAWWPPESSGMNSVIEYGDPRNPLGSHWIGLEHEKFKGYGIHGTTEPETISKESSLGCIRMLNDHVKEIYEVAYTGMEVKILD